MEALSRLLRSGGKVIDGLRAALAGACRQSSIMAIAIALHRTGVPSHSQYSPQVFLQVADWMGYGVGAGGGTALDSDLQHAMHGRNLATRGIEASRPAP